MQCPNCSFHNTPGTAACVRCRSTLDLSGVEVIPPRAPKGQVTLAGRAVVRRAGYRAADRAARAGAVARMALNPDVNLGALLRAVVPGWGHLYIGQRSVAAVALGVWTAILLANAAGAGGPLSWFLFCSLIGCHGCTITLLLSRPLSSQPLFRRAEVGVLVFAVLGVGLYLPGRWAIRNVAVATQLNGLRDTPILHDRDTVVCTGAWTRPEAWRRGDLVLYRIRPAMIPGIVLRGGLGVDRILALPGDMVVISKGTVTVNDRPIAPEWGPIAPLRWSIDLEFVVHEGTYFILPSALRLDAQGAGVNQMIPQVAVAASSVGEADIVGRVWWRLRPWGRFGGIEGAGPMQGNGL